MGFQRQVTFYGPLLIVMLSASLLIYLKAIPELPQLDDAAEGFRKGASDATYRPKESNTTVVFVPPQEIEVKGPNNTTVEQTTTSTRAYSGVVNAAILVSAAAAGGVGIYLLVKYRRDRALFWIFSVAFGFVAGTTGAFFAMTSWEAVAWATGWYPIPWATLSLAGSFLVLAVGIPIGLFSKRSPRWARNVTFLAFGSLTGAFLAAVLPIYVCLFLILFVAVYDVWAVFRGPIGKMMEVADRRREEDRVLPVGSTDRSPSDPATAPSVPVGGPFSLGDRCPVGGAGGVRSRSDAPPPRPMGRGGGDARRLAGVLSGLAGRRRLAERAGVFEPGAEKGFRLDERLIYPHASWELGFGDFVFYAMLASITVDYVIRYQVPFYTFYSMEIGLWLPWAVQTLVVAGILMGFRTTWRLLDRHALLPGTPITLGFGVCALASGLACMEIANWWLGGRFVPPF